MSVQVYKTDVGLFSLIVDDDTYNFVNSVDSGDLIKNDLITEYGSNIFENIPLLDLYMTVCEYKYTDAVVYGLMSRVFKSLEKHVLLNVSSEKNRDNFPVNMSTNKYITVQTEYQRGDDRNLFVTCFLNNNDNLTLLGSSGRYPYGQINTYYSSGSIYVLISNSKITNFLIYSISVDKDTRSVNGSKINVTNSNEVSLFFNDLTPIKISEDPYTKGGNSSDGGGGGTFGGGSSIFGGNTDPIDIPELPGLSAVDTGFITLFNPTLSQLNSLASYMWSDVFSLDTFKKLYADPMDCILGLSIVPVQPASGGTGTVKIGNISTDVSMNKASSQYVSVDCGTVEVKEYWGGYLDYSPYTKCEIYLPYVGVHEISVDDIMNKSVHIVYHVDILSGACNAYVKCGDSVLYTFIGQCSSSIPISGNDWTNTINGVLSIAGNIGSLVASGGASAPTELPSMAQNAVNALKPNVEKSGAMSGTGGMLGIQKPYIILTRPNQALPENQNKYTGYPSFITMNLGECSGYTEIETIRLENMTCTDDELTEIETLLKQGVVF